MKLEVVVSGTDEDPWGNTRVGLEAVGCIKPKITIIAGRTRTTTAMQGPVAPSNTAQACRTEHRRVEKRGDAALSRLAR